MSEVCSKLGIPKELERNNRPPDQIFNCEKIYRRFQGTSNIEDWKSDRGISSSIFPVKNDSCNREKYSTNPTDVLYNIREQDGGAHYFGTYGILEFSSDIIYEFENSSLEINNVVRKFTLQLIHSPEECMYPHCEVLVLENGNRIQHLTAKSIKSAIRVFLIDNCTVL